MDSASQMDLMLSYNSAESGRCVQFDALVGVKPGDGLIQADEDGNLICWGDAYESVSAVAPVRLWIRSDTPKHAALALLKKIAEVVEQCYEPALAESKVENKAEPVGRHIENRTNVIEFPTGYRPKARI